MTNLIYATVAIGVIGLLYAVVLYHKVKKAPKGNERMREIQSFIKEGAMAFLKKEYTILAFFTLVVFLVIGIVLPLGKNVSALNAWLTALNFLIGAFLSALAGFIGMRAATSANSAVANAAKDHGMSKALSLAFSGGSVMGFCVVSLGLLGLSLVYLIESNLPGFNPNEGIQDVINGFGLGASSIALFARVGGGIYTKAADVGADLVGKVEVGIPEDDPRNPSVIADNVGDNVGDVAGMGADLFESYVGSIIASITLSLTMQMPTSDTKHALYKILDGFASIDEARIAFAVFPLLICGIGILATIFGSLFIGNGQKINPHKSLKLGTYITAGITVIASLVLSFVIFNSIRPFVAIISGLIAGILIGIFTEIYTSSDHHYVKRIADQSKTGAATNIICGISVGMVSTALPVLIIAISTLLAYYFANLYGIALASVGMLSIVGNTIAIDAYGPIADNAGGIAQMSNLPHEVREITDHLDSVGNTTAAIGKGFAISSAALTALALFASYAQVADINMIDILNPSVVVGMLIGAMLPFLFSALAMSSVGKAANVMIMEVRRQFKEKPGILEGTEKPEYAKCIEISTAAAIKEMVLPSIIAILAPILTGIILGKNALGGLLAGSLVSGIMLAIFMANSGGAWDNAKKAIEQGQGKGTFEDSASVIGDTVGDPFKDTAGPSLNILIKLMTIVALVFASIFGNGIFG